MDPILKREIILDNYQNPKNKGLVDDKDYITIKSSNESCIDDLDIQYKIENGVITDIHFDGEECAISTSATSIMINALIGKNIDYAKKILENYENMINEKDYDKELLAELNVYEEIYLQPNRKKCAFLPFTSLKKIIEKLEQ